MNRNLITPMRLSKAISGLTTLQAGAYLRTLLHLQNGQPWPQHKTEIARIVGVQYPHLDRVATGIERAVNHFLAAGYTIAWYTMPRYTMLDALKFSKSEGSEAEKAHFLHKNATFSTTTTNLYKDIVVDTKMPKFKPAEPKFLWPTGAPAADTLAQALKASYPEYIMLCLKNNGLRPDQRDTLLAEFSEHHWACKTAVNDERHLQNMWRKWCSTGGIKSTSGATVVQLVTPKPLLSRDNGALRSTHG